MLKINKETWGYNYIIIPFKEGKGSFIGIQKKNYFHNLETILGKEAEGTRKGKVIRNLNESGIATLICINEGRLNDLNIIFAIQNYLMNPNVFKI